MGVDGARESLRSKRSGSLILISLSPLRLAPLYLQLVGRSGLSTTTSGFNLNICSNTPAGTFSCSAVAPVRCFVLSEQTRPPFRRLNNPALAVTNLSWDTCTKVVHPSAPVPRRENNTTIHDFSPPRIFQHLQECVLMTVTDIDLARSRGAHPRHTQDFPRYVSLIRRCCFHACCTQPIDFSSYLWISPDKARSTLLNFLWREVTA